MCIFQYVPSAANNKTINSTKKGGRRSGQKKSSYSNPCMKIFTEKDKNTEIKENSFAFDLSAENAIS